MAFRVLTDGATPKEQKAVRCYDLTSKIENGKLVWKAPKGEWRLIAAFVGKTFQKVKRAAPGGEGYVMNHFSAKAVSNYLNRFERLLPERRLMVLPELQQSIRIIFSMTLMKFTVPTGRTNLFESFARRRGYKLEHFLPDFLSERPDRDYPVALSPIIAKLLPIAFQENFIRQWTDWAHKHGSRTRNQAHGSPGNLIDLYATVDVPECEGFGLSDFGIRGLRKDSLTRPNDSDLSMLKYASSAALLPENRSRLQKHSLG